MAREDDSPHAGHHGKPGEPGEPGRPGEPGKPSGVGGTGGTGGAGGRGGAGGVAEAGFHIRWLDALALTALIVAFVVAAVAIKLALDAKSNTDKIRAADQAIQANQREIAELEIERQQVIDTTAVLARDLVRSTRAARQLSRQTDYRLCVRQVVTRAAVNADRAGDEPILPLYDCTPDLSGKPARLLTSAQARALRRQIEQNHYRP